MGLLSETTQGRASAAIKEGLASCCPILPQQKDSKSADPVVQEDKSDDEFDFNIGDGTNNTTMRRSLQSSICDAEFERFCESDSTNVAILHAFPIVKEAFLKFNTLLPSSAPVERMLSFATMFDISKFNRLTDENFEKRVLSRANCKQRKA